MVIDGRSSKVSQKPGHKLTNVSLRLNRPVVLHLATLPKNGALFPYLQTVRAGDRATEFKQRCVGLGIHGVTVHSYRYAWAKRANVVGYPERFAQLALGHNSNAVHRAYAKNALVTLPPLEEYERKIVSLSNVLRNETIMAETNPQETTQVVKA